LGNVLSYILLTGTVGTGVTEHTRIDPSRSDPSGPNVSGKLVPVIPIEKFGVPICV